MADDEELADDDKLMLIKPPAGRLEGRPTSAKDIDPDAEPVAAASLGFPLLDALAPAVVLVCAFRFVSFSFFSRSFFAQSSIS